MIWDRLGVLTDEVSPDLREALDWAAEHRLAHVEIRTVEGRNVIDLADAALLDIRKETEKRGLFVSAVASPVFKCALDPSRPVQTGDAFGQREERVEAHYRKLERAIEIAGLLGTKRIRIFSFWRENDPKAYESDIVTHLKAAAAMAEKAGVTLLLENEPSCNGGYAAEVGRLARLAASPALKVLWDPGNEAYGGKPAYPEGYGAVKDVIGHVHLKDALTDEGGVPRCVPIGQGAVPYGAQLSALERDGYSGLYTIETHYVPEGGTAAHGTGLTLEGLRTVLSAGRTS
ncbi:xylose isomerase [Gordoniibacillus kamchatkensis]|uniref:Xylose isomerase n=2 Tax=Gordoniibacillus kamchatkensis TaxID=1590651 RepID=A0ABR5ALI5_9BACL|nr:xylose isomerase [Paenibacillus sp. VKM B-2647]